MTDDLRDELHTLLVAALRTFDRIPEGRAIKLTDHLAPVVLTYMAEELALGADLLLGCIENPEMPWAQGVEFSAEALSRRGEALLRQARAGGWL